MKKSLSLLMVVCLLSCPVLAQDMDLFPELKGRFKPAETDTKEQKKEDLKPVYKGPTVPDSPYVNLDNYEGQQKEGNVKIQFTNLKGVLPYARNFSYCFADAVLTNQTNQTLQQLHVTLTYQESENDLNFGGVPKKGQQIRKIMMNGPECASILTMPKVDIKTCKMENQSDDACQKRIQFIPPND